MRILSDLRGDPGAAPGGVADALLAAVWSTADDGLLTVDSNGVVRACNRSAERIFGYPTDQIVGGNWTALFPVHLRRDVIRVLETAAAGERVHRFETEIVRRDGMPAPVSLSACAFGRPTAVAVIVRDITEQELAQATLAEIEARVRESEAFAHVGSWLWDVRTGVVQWSDELHRIHGVDPLDFDGTVEAHLAAVHPDDRGAVRAAMDDAVAADRSFDAEYRIIRGDATVRWLRARARPTVGSAGVAIGLRGIGQDVTDRHEAGSWPSQ